jgi:hypothetical protein
MKKIFALISLFFALTSMAQKSTVYRIISMNGKDFSVCYDTSHTSMFNCDKSAKVKLSEVKDFYKMCETLADSSEIKNIYVLISVSGSMYYIHRIQIDFKNSISKIFEYNALSESQRKTYDKFIVYCNSKL